MENGVLRALGPAIVASLAPCLEEIDLSAGLTLFRAGSRMHHLVFPLSGLISNIASAGADRIEVGLIGWEGVLGASGLLRAESSPVDAVVQISGRALQVSFADLEHLTDGKAALSSAVYKYLTFLLMQICYTSLANGRGTVERRLGRWLLMAHDRLLGDEVPLTHEFLAHMLGVRRPGVTVSLQVMEGHGAIRSKRSSIVIRDREKLKELAGDGYGPSESLYHRLFGFGLSKG